MATALTETATTPSLRDRVESLRLPDRVDAKVEGPRASWLPWIFCLMLAATTVTVLVKKPAVSTAPPEAAAGPAKAATADAPRPADAPKAAAPAAAAGSVTLETKGNIIPAHQIQVSPIEVSGRIVELFIEEGKRFKAGDVLAQLDKALYEADLSEATHMLTSAKERLRELENGSRPEEVEQGRNELSEAEETLKQLERDYKRNTTLRGTGGALSPREQDAAEFAYKAQIQRVNKLRRSLDLLELGPRAEKKSQARADVLAAEARLRKAQWRFDNCTIRSPVTGTVLSKKAEIGSLLSPLSFNVAASLCDIADLSDLEVDLDIVERDISKVFKGQKCQVRSEAYPDRTYPGVVDRLMPIANRGKAAVPVRVKVSVPREEEGVYLKPEMGVIVTFFSK